MALAEARRIAATFADSEIRQIRAVVGATFTMSDAEALRIASLRYVEAHGKREALSRFLEQAADRGVDLKDAVAEAFQRGLV